ncbi:MAG: 8-amino-7-oxononanoate synthase [bacterium]|nr:8-amino-7-oxononanoate synthase [bacterium]
MERPVFKRTLKPFTCRKKGQITVNSRLLWDFSSNDYLGFATEPGLKQSAAKIIQEYGMGSTGSRLLSGNHLLFHKLEEKTARLVKKESSLIFNSGYHANTGIINSLLNRKDVVFADRLIHASLIDGIKLSGAKLFRYRHNDMNHLEILLKKHRTEFNNAMIVSESIFSMDGDAASLQDIVFFKKKYNCLILIDEAHAFGVFGNNGAGLVESEGLSDKVDILVATFGKALGGYGAYAACSKKIKQVLINKSRSFIYSTAVPPAVIAWNTAALDLLQDSGRRDTLIKNSKYFRSLLQKSNITSSSCSQIVPVITGNSRNNILLAEKLQSTGFWILPVQPPTVASGKERIRISLTCHHTTEILETLAENIALSDLL